MSCSRNLSGISSSILKPNKYSGGNADWIPILSFVIIKLRHFLRLVASNLIIPSFFIAMFNRLYRCSDTSRI
nr:MAG TPA: hypothetical protein [Caudoviricetes sp.]